MLVPAVAEPDDRRIGRYSVEAHIAHLEQDILALFDQLGEQILHHLLLLVDRHALPDQRPEIDVMEPAARAEIDPVVEHALLEQARSGADLDQKIVRPLLDQAGADAVLDIGAAAVFEHDRLHAGPAQQERQHETRGTRSDNADLSAHVRCSELTARLYAAPCACKDAHDEPLGGGRSRFRGSARERPRCPP